MKTLTGFFMFAALCCSQARALELKTGVHIHTNFSHGDKQTMAQVVQRATEKKLDAVIITDTLITKFQYGLRPFENVLKVSGSQGSILKEGPRKYLNTINSLRKQYPELLIVPGTEAAAFYRWEGDPFKKLIMKDWHRHMLIFGLEKPSDFSGLPVMGNSRSYPLDWKLLAAALALALVLWRSWRHLGRRGRIAAGIFGALGFFLLYPFATPRWSVYSETTPWEPYRALAAYAQSKGALAFWAHPEAPNWLQPQQVKGPLYVAADQYPDGLAQVPEINGFAMFMEGYKHMMQPGAEWDAALLSYTEGKRPVPPWALAELDFVAPGYMGTDIDTAYMLVSADAKTPAALLDGLRRGSFQSVMGSDGGAMRFSKWEMRASPAVTASAGQELELQGKAALSVGLEKSSGTISGAELSIVCDGELLSRQLVEFPSEIKVDYSPRRQRGYCRAYAINTNSMASSNPIFYRRSVK